jgi:hypothetical protein
MITVIAINKVNYNVWILTVYDLTPLKLLFVVLIVSTYPIKHNLLLLLSDVANLRRCETVSELPLMQPYDVLHDLCGLCHQSF